MISDKEELIPRITLTEMVTAWEQSCADIRQAFALLVGAEQRLKSTFRTDSHKFSLESRARSGHNRAYSAYTEPELLFKELKKDAWAALLDRIEVRRLLSVKRCKELDHQLETGEGLPEINELQILDMLTSMVGRLDEYLEEAVKEVFEFLRPHRSGYVTNSEFEIGNKVILGWAVDLCSYRRDPNSPKFQLTYGGSRRNELRALDNVFHLLDGKGIAPSFQGPLCSGIETSPTGKVETEYFKAKCFANRNIHLEFRRMDLVAKLNAVAGGARLRAKGNGESS